MLFSIFKHTPDFQCGLNKVTIGITFGGFVHRVFVITRAKNTYKMSGKHEIPHIHIFHFVFEPAGGASGFFSQFPGSYFASVVYVS